MANEQLQSTIETLYERRRKRERMTRIGWIVAGVCALILLVCLMVPAFTMEHNKYDCGLEEHTHTAQCYTNEVVCGLPTEKAHVHTPSCYSKSGKLTCEKVEAGHIHLDPCYDKNGKLVCDKEETVHIHKASCFDSNGNNVCKNKDALHVHGDTCYKVVKSDTDKSSKESADEKDSKSTKEPVAYQLTCNEESVGHVHRDACYDDNGKLVCGKDEKIEIPHKHDESCYEKVLACGQEEHTHTDECLKEEVPATPAVDEEGNPIDGDSAGNAEGDTVADENVDLVDESAEPDLTDKEIKEAEDQGLLYENDKMLVVFNVPDEIKDSVKLKVTETDDEVVPYSEQDLTVTKNEDGVVTVDTDGDESVVAEGDGASAGDSPDATSSEPAEGNQGAAARSDEGSASSKSGSKEKPAYQTNLHIDATLDGQPVENIEDLGITAKIEMKPNFVAPILDKINYKKVASEIKNEVGAVITVTQQPVAPANATLSEIPDAQVDTTVITDTDNSAIVVSILDDDVEVQGEETQNARFKVSYSAYVDSVLTVEQAKAYAQKHPEAEFADKELDSIEMIDTTGGELPTNTKGTKNKKTSVAVYKFDTNKWKIVSVKEPALVYAEREFTYFGAPNMSYFNVLLDNDGYKVKDIVVKHDDNCEYGCQGETTYTDVAKLHFTNNPNYKDKDNYILIDNDTHITINYECQTTDKDFNATFYDYDITGTDADGNLTANKMGINADDNYSKNGSKFAFGNEGPKTGLAFEEDNDGFFINIANSQGNIDNFKQTARKVTDGVGTFGIAQQNLTKEGKIQYADGIVAPALFDESDTEVIGKTPLTDYQLGFSQNGDTFTINKVLKNKTDILSDLGQFKSMTKWSGGHLFSNDFWAVDEEKSGDPKYEGRYTGLKNTLGTKFNDRITNYHQAVAYLPESDFGGVYHNGYFGMTYSVEFDLIEDYIGPLNYYFFGDDDMWVYLDGKLICDIGGVHPSYGEYVNIWDYIDGEWKTDENGNKYKCGDGKKHTLKFYYTERGAAGSTCYMRFTLPSVTSANPDTNPNSASFRLQKQTEGNGFADDQTFKFSITLKDEDGNVLPDNYSYTKYNGDGTPVSEPNLIFPSKTDIDLQKDQYIQVSRIPDKAKIQITEIGDYKPSITLNGSSKTIEEMAEGFRVDKGNPTYNIVFVNDSYVLPDTGGTGVYWYWLGGGALIILAAYFWRRRACAATTVSASSSGEPELRYNNGGHRAVKSADAFGKRGRQ